MTLLQETSIIPTDKVTANVAASSDVFTPSGYAPTTLSLSQLFSWLKHPAIRQGTVVLFDQGFCSIANFLTGVLIARACTKGEYGLYIFSFSLLATVMGIQVSLTGTPFTVLSPSLKGANHKSYLGSTLCQHLVISGLTSIGFIIAAAVVSMSGRTDGLSSILFALAIASVFVLLRDFMRYVLLAQLRVWSSLFMGLAANIATVTMLAWAYLTGRLNPSSAYMIVALCSGLPVIAVMLRRNHEFIFNSGKLAEHISKNWRFGKWLIARTVAGFFSIQIFPWTLLLFKGSEATGAFGACVTLAGIANPLFMGINRFIGPKTAHAACKGGASIRQTAFKVILLLVAPIALFVVAFMIFGELAMVRIFGDDYAGTGLILRIYVIAVALEALMGPIGAGIHAMKKPNLTFQAEVITALVSIVLGVPAVILLGPVGAVLGFLISTLTRRIYYWIQFQKLTSTRSSECRE